MLQLLLLLVPRLLEILRQLFSVCSRINHWGVTSVDPIEKLTSWSCGAPRLRLLRFLIGFYQEIDQVEVCSPQTQNALLSYYVRLRNWPVGTLELPDSECFTFLLISIEKLTSWSSEAVSLRMFHELRRSGWFGSILPWLELVASIWTTKNKR